MGDPNRDGQLTQIGIGLDAEAFMDSPLGRDFLGMVSNRAIESMDKLKNIKPSNYTTLDRFALAVTDLQNEVLRAETFEEWMVEVVETGRNVEENMIQQEAEET